MYSAWQGKALNLTSSFWFENTKDIVPNHMIAVPHPNVLIAEQAMDTLPIEMVIRGYMARSSTSTSIYHNYVDLGRREVYGIRFPEGLKANEEFLHPIITPTTKGEVGDHDEELTGEEARDMVDSKFEKGTYEKARLAAIKLFERGVGSHRESGLILVDTKYEFGLDKDGKLMLIDELHTSDSSRIWLKNTYQQKFESGENPDTFDKDILRRNLAENGFRGEGLVPIVDPKVIDEMALAYTIPYKMVSGIELPETATDPADLQRDIQTAVEIYFNK
jgi:phosphoribosylaminoimidazole-succinocarboxamide synthase